MARLSIETALERLRERNPDIAFDGGERSDGFWISAKDQSGAWQWERSRMTSPGSALYFAEVALVEFAGAKV